LFKPHQHFFCPIIFKNNYLFIKFYLKKEKEEEEEEDDKI
jgi:hypothetical protein